MTELIGRQLLAMGLMICGGISAGMVYGLFGSIRKRLKSRILACGAEMISLAAVGYLTSIFLYASHYGKITFQGIVCFFCGLILWRKLIFTEDGEMFHGEEGEQTPGIREE